MHSTHSPVRRSQRDSGAAQFLSSTQRTHARVAGSHRLSTGMCSQ
jgi:hypothetical protein